MIVIKMPHPYFFRKNVPDYSASREKNDLGFITFDLEAGILSNNAIYVI